MLLMSRACVPAVSSKFLISAAVMASRPLWSPLFGPSPPKWNTQSSARSANAPSRSPLANDAYALRTMATLGCSAILDSLSGRSTADHVTKLGVGVGRRPQQRHGRDTTLGLRLNRRSGTERRLGRHE